MADLQLVVSDTAPSIFGALTDAAGAPIDLTDAVVRFQMRPATDRRFSVDAAAIVVDATAGEVRYDWQAGDLVSAGDFVSRWRIVFADDSIDHSDPANTITVVSQ